MAEVSAEKTRSSRRFRRIRHRGRGSQILIYLGKQLRFFINENDWKVLPMAAVIAALVGMVIRQRLFVNMEGSLIGAFSLTCVAIWNGCFNSIQSVCRERPIVKREHRSGMHISSYVLAHMIYQLMLCLLQTGLTMYVLKILEVQFPAEGFMTRWMIVDVGISMLLITYASDMMSLFLSSISHTTTGAMTLMPFVLIFQLVFSGGIIPLPAWSQSLSNFTISNYGIQVIAAQSGYNEMPMVTAWNTLEGMKEKEIGGTVTVGQVVDFLSSEGMKKYREKEILPAMNLNDLIMTFAKETGMSETDMQILQTGLNAQGNPDEMTEPIRLGQVIDLLSASPAVQERRDKSFTFRTTIGEMLELAGEEKVRDMIQKATAEASYKQEYEQSMENIVGNWVILGMFALLFAALSVLVLEMIDKDKR